MRKVMPGRGHLEWRCVVVQQLLFKDARLYRPDDFAKRIGNGTFQAVVILDGNEVRMILPEPRQHTGVNLSVKVVHEEGAEDRDFLFVRQLIEQVLKSHAGGGVAAFPQNIDHLAPPANPRILVPAPGARHYFASKPQENGRIWHLLTHEARQELVRVDHGQLTP